MQFVNNSKFANYSTNNIFSLLMHFNLSKGALFLLAQHYLFYKITKIPFNRKLHCFLVNYLYTNFRFISLGFPMILQNFRQNQSPQKPTYQVTNVPSAPTDLDKHPILANISTHFILTILLKQ